MPGWGNQFKLQRQFAKSVRRSLKENESSIRKLAKEADISPSYISRIMNLDRNLPSDDKILAIAKALKIYPPEELLIEIGRVPHNNPLLLEVMQNASRLDKIQLMELEEYIIQTYHGDRVVKSIRDAQEVINEPQ